MEAREYLRDILYTRREVDDWLAGRARPWKGYVRYDGELGWLFRSGRFRDGVDESTSTYNFDDLGARRMMTYPDKSCRINTYGDSFTECHQVSDGETWQEVLAAHLCEPIRNFGVGGYSVYQAYLRMRREEARTPAEYIIFNIYDDDHYRNLNGLGRPTRPYVKVNPATGEFVECPNPCPTPESLYNQCDLEQFYQTSKDDLGLKIRLALGLPFQREGEPLQKILEHGRVEAADPERSHTDFMDLASEHGIRAQIDSSEELVKTADTLYKRAAIFASKRIVEKVEEFAAANGKTVLYVLSFRSNSIAKRVNEGDRFDQEFVDFLQSKKLPHVDLMEEHLAEFAQFKTSIEDYLKRYYIGHYNPLGNFFQAFAIKNDLVEMLRPKPISYQETE